MKIGHLVAISFLLPRICVAQSASVTGVIVDSLHNEPLENAAVILEGSGSTVRTDASGRFSINALKPGTYDLTVLHPVADSLGLSLEARQLHVAPGSVVQVLLAVPGVEGVRRILCGDQTATSGGIIRGQVRRSNHNEGIAGARVTLSWLSVGVAADTKGILTSEGATSITDARGYYTFCGLPADFEGTAQVFTATDTTGAVSISLTWSPSGILARPFLLPATPHAVSRISGRVMDDEGHPVAGALIDVPGHNNTVKSKADGTFALSGPAGTQTLRVRKLGFPATIAGVDVTESSAPLELRLGTPVSRLATVVVRGMLSEVADRTGFSRRALSGPGKYVTAEQLEKSGARCVLDAMRHALIYLTKGLGCSVDLVSNMHFRGISSLQGLGPALPDKREAVKLPVASVAASACMLVFVDDLREPTTSQPGREVVDLSWLDPADVAGIEFYSAASAPGRYGQSRCNLILIWTLSYRGAHY